MRSAIRLPLLLAGLLPGTAAAEPAPPPPPAIQRFTLDNGLRVALRPLRMGDAAAAVLLFDFGEDADPEGRCGLAHLCEHLWCTAATALKPARTVEGLAAAHPLGWNAQTGRTYTVFASVTAPDGLVGELEDMADRLDSLSPTAADLAREKPRLLEELENMYGRIPALGAMNRLMAPREPWSSPRRGGMPGNVEAITLEEARGFLAAHYRAGNARLVLSGNFDPEVAEKAIRSRFGDLPRGTPPERRLPPGVRLDMGGGTSDGFVKGPPLITIEEKEPRVPGSRICLGWNGPLPGEEGYAAFTVLAARLMFRTAQGVKPGEDGPRGMLLPLDLPGPAFLAAPLLEGEKPDAALARMRKEADAILDLPIADGMYCGSMLAPFLGTVEVPPGILARNPYGDAFGIGRRDQLGIDGPALMKEMSALTADDLAAARKRWFPDGPAAVVLTR